eukprot:364774-Chlamydomonas_euryale.AAC.16
MRVYAVQAGPGWCLVGHFPCEAFSFGCMVPGAISVLVSQPRPIREVADGNPFPPAAAAAAMWADGGIAGHGSGAPGQHVHIQKSLPSRSCLPVQP